MIKLLTQKEQIRFFKKLKKFLNFNKKKLLIFNNLFTLLKKKVILNYSIEDNFYRVKFFVINFSNRHNSFRRLKRWLKRDNSFFYSYIVFKKNKKRIIVKRKKFLKTRLLKRNSFSLISLKFFIGRRLKKQKKKLNKFFKRRKSLRLRKWSQFKFKLWKKHNIKKFIYFSEYYRKKLLDQPLSFTYSIFRKRNKLKFWKKTRKKRNKNLLKYVEKYYTKNRKQYISKSICKNVLKKNYFIFNTTLYAFSQFFLQFSRFRNKDNCYLIMRYNYKYSMYFEIKKDILTAFSQVKFPKSYKLSFLKYLSLMFFTKDLHKFTIFVKYLIEGLSRTGQKNFFYTFNSMTVSNFNIFFKKYDICGFYLRANGKIGGYAGDRTKRFLVQYGKISRSIRKYKYNYNQTTAVTRCGSIGINVLLTYF